jgi:hypothetical protein
MTSSPRRSLLATVLRIAAVATIAAVLLWSVLFVDLLHRHSQARAALSQPAGQVPRPAGGDAAQAPAPVTTRTS